MVKPLTAGCFAIAEFFGDQMFIDKFGFMCRDFDALLGLSEEQLGDLATRYLDLAFVDSKAEAMFESIKWRMEMWSRMTCELSRGWYFADREYKTLTSRFKGLDEEMKHFISKFIPAVAKEYQRWDIDCNACFTSEQFDVVNRELKDYGIEVNNGLDLPLELAIQPSILSMDQFTCLTHHGVVEQLEGKKIADFVALYFANLRALWDYSPENTEIIAPLAKIIQMEQRVTSFLKIQRFFWGILQDRFHIFEQLSSVAQKVRSFIKCNPALARFVWEDETFRKTLIQGYIKVPIKQEKLFCTASFDELPSLLERKARNVDSDLQVFMNADPELQRLYKAYNSLVSFSGEEGEIAWNRIVQRQVQLMGKYQASHQKKAQRPIPRAGFFT